MANKEDKNAVDRSIFHRMDYFLFHLCSTVLLQSLVVSGYLNSINTTIERRYKLTTKEIGYIYMSYELACIPTTIVLSLIGHKLNRARLIGICGCIMSIGFLMFSLPHFIGSTYHLVICDDNSTVVLCNPKPVLKTEVCSKDVPDTWALLIFCVSQVLIGIGASPIYVLGPTYLWDNLSNKDYSIRSSIFYTCGGLGPPIGFLLGGYFLGIYIDSPKQPKCDNMNPNHTLWLGAWWIGLVMIASISILVVMPLLKFPKMIPRKKKIESLAVMENDNLDDKPEKTTHLMKVISGDSNPQSSQIISELDNRITIKISTKFIPNSFKELRSLFSNTIWLLMSMTTVMEQSIVQACTTYISKYLQVLFNVPANHASYLVGGLVVPGAISGVLFGGLLMHKFQPSQNNAIRGMIFMISATGLLTIILMFLGCDDLHVAGVTIDYNNFSISANRKFSLDSSCNSACYCSVDNYEPVCNSKEAKNYYSPCHAGCKSLSNIGSGTHGYNNCDCSASQHLSVGKCTPYCPTYYISLVIVFFQVFLTATGQIPINIVTLRSVSVKQSSLALGVQVFMVRLFAYIPVPLYFGALFDYACIIRVMDKCTKGSICHEYNVTILPFIWLGTVAAIKLLNFILIVCTYICLKENHKSTFTLKMRSSNLNNSNANVVKSVLADKLKDEEKNRFFPYGIGEYLCYFSFTNLYGSCLKRFRGRNLNESVDVIK